MKKPKLRGHIRAPYLRFKAFVRSRLLSSVSTSSHATSTPRQSTRTFTPPQVEEKFVRVVDITFRNGKNLPWPTHYTHGAVLFDTGSEYNLVTSQFLESNEFEWQPSASLTRIFQMDGTEIRILGEVQGRWYPENAPKDDNFPPLYQTSTFKVVDFKNCELIIGRATINELKLLQPNRTFFGAFIGAPIRVDRTLCPCAVEAQLLSRHARLKAPTPDQASDTQCRML
jgi:hypothetical protein